MKTVDEYINSYDGLIKERLMLMRKLVQDIASSSESISYGMPTYKVNNKVLTHFAAFKNHIGMYPTPTPIEDFKDDLKPYKTSKGAIQFPNDQDLPVKLIKKILKSRLDSII